MSDKALGYILNTGAGTGVPTQFGHLTTIDLPTYGDVIYSCLGRQGVYVLTEKKINQNYENEIYVLPEPGGTTDVPYETAPKMEYRWRSKKFVTPGRTTFSAAKVVYARGCVRLRLLAHGCCVFEEQIRNCSPFRLPSQVSGTEFEIELIGDAIVYDVHIASSMTELAT